MMLEQNEAVEVETQIPTEAAASEPVHEALPGQAKGVFSTIGQEIDALVAENVMGHEVIRFKKGTLKERTLAGTTRPLRPYSRDINAAWEVASKMKVTLIPVEGDMWFALVGTKDGWQSPADLLKYMADQDFTDGGAAVKDSAPLAICLAALTAVSKRKSKSTPTETPTQSV